MINIMKFQKNGEKIKMIKSINLNQKFLRMIK